MKIKVKLWIEDKEKNLVFGDGKNLIMKHLDKTGCTKKTALELKMSEENIFRHLDILEDNNTAEMVLKIQGLKKDSKSSYVLTAEAREILQTYHIFQHDVRRFANKKFDEFIKDKGK